MNTQSINDDDWYELDQDLKIVRSYSPRAFVWQRDPVKLANGHIAVKGIRYKSMIAATK